MGLITSSICLVLKHFEREILTAWVCDYFQEGKLEALVENDVEALNNMKILERFVMVGIWCIQEDPFLRPSMRKVIQMLEGVVEGPNWILRRDNYNRCPGSYSSIIHSSVTPPVVVCAHKGKPTLGILPSNWTMCPWLDEFPRQAEQVPCATTSQMVSPREVVGLLMVITLLGYRLV
ncbi:hypothetical protein LguiA_021734 [Lonicera macranthoides]